MFFASKITGITDRTISGQKILIFKERALKKPQTFYNYYNNPTEREIIHFRFFLRIFAF